VREGDHVFRPVISFAGVLLFHMSSLPDLPLATPSGERLDPVAATTMGTGSLIHANSPLLFNLR